MLKDGGEPILTARQGRQVLKFALAAEESAQKGNPLDCGGTGMNSSHDFPETQAKRAQWFKSHGGVNAVVEAGLLSNTVSMGLTEVLVLGLIRQGVTKFLMILGHGSTEFGETLRVYESAGLVRGFQFRNEVEMAHTATALRWVYDEPQSRGYLYWAWRSASHGSINCFFFEWGWSLSHLW